MNSTKEICFKSLSRAEVQKTIKKTVLKENSRLLMIIDQGFGIIQFMRVKIIILDIVFNYFKARL